ncbi:MAG TPA: phosphoribosylformylglycinamidine synthase subunit PurQ [Dermatophilaceae bacterium]|jgi:phosphoribosylformylglycinamidine synthase subunit PurQ / glutaminase|nr:phosphoribosylformylglycinamidine synthase subunit PurQ [Dermatophilaceae bacterium]
MKIGVVTFPGSLDDHDAHRAVRVAGGEPVSLWHGDDSLRDVDAVVLPGGFSYGDYLRAGAIARFAPVMSALIPAAQGGLPVLGICNGFQILCESHLLPGAMIQNDHRTFICRDQRLRVENATTAWTSDFAQDDEITIVLKNQDGQYVADRHTLDELEGEGRVAFRYVIEHSVVDGPDAPAAVRYDRFASRNPNGSYRDIAGVTNERGNVVGLMPHPEHAIEEGYGPSLDGLKFFTSVLKSVVNA